jgi:hypothetical protein
MNLQLGVVVLKDGTELPASTRQIQWLQTMAILTEDLTKKRVRLDGREFTLADIETDPKKLFKNRQQALGLDDARKKDQNWG